MKNILITESQLKSIQEMHINGESLYYDNTQILNEEWWNTLGDVVGIFDPTGVVDSWSDQRTNIGSWMVLP